MILLTGAAGFIGSVLAGSLNALGRPDLILIDDFSQEAKRPNWEGKQYLARIHRDELENLLHRLSETAPDTWPVGWTKPEVVFHIGARTDTAEQDPDVFERLNVGPSKLLWNYCSRQGIPLIYASSAATYGAGELGYSDDHAQSLQLKPLNPYGASKQDFDVWALRQNQQPPFWAGLKFFNVYGPNEYHKGRMASVVMHATRQIEKNGSLKLFRSHRPDYADGMQMRDFIYVKDLCAVALWLWQNQPQSGLYNLGTGKARSFLDLGKATFAALGRPTSISFIDTPQDIRDSYQYYTQAEMGKLRQQGYTAPFHSLEDGIKEYVQEYLMKERYA